MLYKMPSPASRPTVLVVDDDEDLREALATRLADEGLAVQTAPNGAAALAQMALHRPAVVLLDLMMPATDGWEVIEQVDARPELRAIPVLLMTAAHNVDATLRHPVFVKPLDVEAVVHAILTLIRD